MYTYQTLTIKTEGVYLSTRELYILVILEGNVQTLK